MDFAQKGFYVTRGGWKAEVIYVADDKLVVRHYVPYSAESLNKNDINIHALDGAVSETSLTSSVDPSNLAGPWDESGVITDVIHIVHVPALLPQFELGSRIPNRRITDPSHSLHRFQINWDPSKPETLLVEKLL